MTSPLRRKRQTTRPNSAATVRNRHARVGFTRQAITALLVGAFILPGSGFARADRIDSTAVKSRDSGKAQRTKLRWQTYRPAAKATMPATETAVDESTPQANDDSSETVVESLAQPAVDAPRKLAKKSAALAKKTTSRAERHQQREAAHIAKTAATKPKNDPFADPFFEDNPKTKLKVEPIVAQPEQPAAGSPDPFTVPAEETEPVAAPGAEIPVDEAPASETPDVAAEPTDELMPDMTTETEEEEQTLEEQVAQAPQGELAPCPSPNDLKKIKQITTDISAQTGEFPPECRLTEVAYRTRMFEPTCLHWKASALCHKPLYFEQVSLERYGHSWGPVLQPFVSGALFFATVPILPYKMGVDPPCECIYTLGYYRPGSCAPKMIYPIPISLRGGLLETGAVLGAVFLVP